ncbi:uncharacterized protein TRIVIDRAFT_69916 [Trichoderma virens Gv29-8]|uniref:Uncharacterized protein n=1 Tax=Hypocrea virens (strain Gv29-8 / FGSC 10586) TaxID=413071 RepID=G9N4P6_HYPVG|nr:uncharacterized protein TRIVIDRAFT_69916 [Trichoderma virens Gv29-8]EHK18570.1 hypothetical protein TRIVIDRAFT_69916 [Trichoderma virens Gv29-8]UKZ52777.1 hypothetical protein TrVGV298_006564 [Trichoderma virens]
MQMQMQRVGRAATKRPEQASSPPRSESDQRQKLGWAELRRRQTQRPCLLFASKLRFAVQDEYLRRDMTDVPPNSRHAEELKTPDSKGIHNKQAADTQGPSRDIPTALDGSSTSAG